MAHLKQVNENACVLEHSQEESQILSQYNSQTEAMTDHYEAGQLEKAQEIGEQLLSVNPQAFLAIYPFMANIYRYQGNSDKFIELLTQGFDQFMHLFPEDFDPQQLDLPWGFQENRPIFHFLYQYGLLLQASGQWEDCASLYSLLLQLNYEDNVGARYDMLKCLLMMDNPDEALNLLGQYPEDASPEMLFGRALTYWKYGNQEAAREAARDAGQKYPAILKEFTKSEHQPPEGGTPENMEMGGEVHAYELYFDWQELLDDEFVALLKETQ